MSGAPPRRRPRRRARRSAAVGCRRARPRRRGRRPGRRRRGRRPAPDLERGGVARRQVHDGPPASPASPRSAGAHPGGDVVGVGQLAGQRRAGDRQRAVGEGVAEVGPARGPRRGAAAAAARPSSSGACPAGHEHPLGCVRRGMVGRLGPACSPRRGRPGPPGRRTPGLGLAARAAARRRRARASSGASPRRRRRRRVQSPRAAGGRRARGPDDAGAGGSGDEVIVGPLAA